MKRILCIITLCISVSTLSFAQSADEKEVAAAVESFRKALIDPTQASLDALTAPELSYGHSSGKLEDKAAFIDALVSKRSDFVTADLTQLTIKIVGNTAIVRHNLVAEINDGGNAGTTKLGVLLIWQKTQGKWKLLARQAFKLP